MAKLPDIPSLSTSEASPAVRSIMDRLRRAFAEINKEGGFATSSTIQSAVTTVLSESGSGGVGAHTPPKPVGVTATGGFAKIILEWDDPLFDHLGHAEIWRSTGTDVAEAVRVGTTNATVFSDFPPVLSLSATYHYWVRFASDDGTPQLGAYSDMATGSTADESTYVLEVLNDKITSTQVHSLAVDRLYAAVGTIADVIIGTGHITNAMIGSLIQSTNYSTTTGWKIDKNGDAIFHDIYARGDVEASSLKANTLMVKTGNIDDLAVTTLKIAGNAVTVPVGVFSSGSVTTDGSGSEVTVQSVSIDPSSCPVSLVFSFTLISDTNNNSTAYTVRLKKNGTTVVTYTLPVTENPGSIPTTYAIRIPFSACYVDASPASGTNIYLVSLADGSSGTGTATMRSMTAIGLKK